MQRKPLHVYLNKNENHVIGEREDEEEDEGRGCGPQAVEVISFREIIYAT